MRSPLLAVGPALLVAQAAAQEPPPRFPSGTALVRLDLVARDRHGRPLTDLQPHEVTVLENGVAARLADLRFVTIGDGAAPGPPPAAAPSGTEAPVSIVVIVLDALSPQSGETTRKAALELLDQAKGPNVWLALYRIGDGLRLVQGFTQDPSLVAGALGAASPSRTYARPPEAANPRDAAGNPLPQRPAGDESLTVAQRFAIAEASLARYADDMERVQRARGSLYPLLALVRGLREVQGRKSMVLFSDGLHVARDSTSGIHDVFRDVVSEANRANVTVYGLSPAGLQGLAGADEPRPPALHGETSDASARESNRLVLQGNLRAVAEDTGGFLVTDTNDLGPGIARVASELRSWYEIAYVSPLPDSDRGFRRIEVKLSRRGVALRTRSGYYPGPILPASSPPAAPEWPSPLSPSAPAPASPAAPTAPAQASHLAIEPAAPAAAPRSVELDRLLELAGEYVSRYADAFSDLAAEEQCRQWWVYGDRTLSRTTVADMVFVRLPGSLPWGTFRDVFERDGQAIRPKDRRLEALFARPRADAVEQANAILHESARENLGPVYRTANFPTLALLFLLPENRPRFVFERKGRRTFDGVVGIEVRFDEEATPTLVRDRHKNDTPARGQFWIDPVRGTVLRSEARYFYGREERAHVATDYRREPGLDIFVPTEMFELYMVPGQGGRIEARSRYSKYRRFTVSVEEEVAR